MVTKGFCLGGFCLIASLIREARRVVDSLSQRAVVGTQVCRLNHHDEGGSITVQSQ